MTGTRLAQLARVLSAAQQQAQAGNPVDAGQLEQQLNGVLAGPSVLPAAQLPPPDSTGHAYQGKPAAGPAQASASNVGQTEVSAAVGAATHRAYSADAGVDYAEWLTAEDEKVCPICTANEAAGPVAIGAPFPGGVPFPPQHPNCRCTTTPSDYHAVPPFQAQQEAQPMRRFGLPHTSESRERELQNVPSETTVLHVTPELEKTGNISGAGDHEVTYGRMPGWCPRCEGKGCDDCDHGANKCVSCGCGKPHDDHGDDRNITQEDVEAAGAAVSLPAGQAAANIADAFRMFPDADDKPSAKKLTADEVAFIDDAMERVYKKKSPRGNAQTLRDYWTGHGHGGPTHHAFERAIAWGTPGDFDRCVAMVTEHAKMDPDKAKGYCVAGSTRVLPASVVMSVNKPVSGLDDFATTALASSAGRFSRRELRGAYDRYYVGQVVVIQTIGDELTITPNHPVATCQGWVPAAKLQVGDHVVCSNFGKREVSCIGPDVDDIPPTIQQVAETLPFRQVAVSETEDFHGDGTNSKVYTFASYVSLLNNSNATLAQHAAQFVLGRRNVSRAGVLAGRVTRTAQSNPGVLQDAVNVNDGNTVVTSDEDSRLSGPVPFSYLPFSACHLCLENAAAVGDDTIAAQQVTDSAAGNAETGGQFVHRFASRVTTKQVTSVNRREFAGHVYNLDTLAGWYLANSIIVQNCNLRHHDAMGIYPATHAKDIREAEGKEK